LEILGRPVYINDILPPGTAYVMNNTWHLPPKTFTWKRLLDWHKQYQESNGKIHTFRWPVIDEDGNLITTPTPKEESVGEIITHFPIVPEQFKPGHMLYHNASMTYTKVVSISTKESVRNGITQSVTLVGKSARQVNASFCKDYKRAEFVDPHFYLQKADTDVLLVEQIAENVAKLTASGVSASWNEAQAAVNTDIRKRLIKLEEKKKRWYRL
jgi:hypothetical protein